MKPPERKMTLKQEIKRSGLEIYAQRIEQLDAILEELGTSIMKRKFLFGVTKLLALTKMLIPTWMCSFVL